MATRAKVWAVCVGVLLGGVSTAAVVSALPGLAANDRGLAPIPAAAQEMYPDPPPGATVRSPPFPVNQNGMTYGSGVNINAHNPGPELIAAYGTNGAFGYIRASDQDPGAASLEEALTWPSEGYTIALLDQDGVTVIGEFGHFIVSPRVLISADPSGLYAEPVTTRL